MTDLLATIAHYLFGWTVLTLGISWLCAAAYPMVRRYIAACPAQQGAFYTLLYALLAPVIACITLIILSFPRLAKPLVAHHCHGKLCEPHSVDVVVETVLSSAALAMAAAAVFFVALKMGSQLLTSRQRALSLEKLSQLQTSGYLRFDSARPIAWCFGLFKPKVFISSGLLETASAEQRQVILAHELARASRYDNLRKWLLNWATLVWPKASRGKIRRDFVGFCNAICDLKAFTSLYKTMDISSFVSTLAHFYGSSTNRVPDNWQQRLQDLQREWRLQQGEQQLGVKPHSLLFGVIAAVTGFCVVAMSVYIGHPLIEVLS